MSRHPENRRQLMDGVLWEGRPMRVLLFGAVVPLALAMLDLGDLGMPRWAVVTLGVALSLFVVLGYGLYQYRKLSIGGNGLVLHGLFRTRGVRWEEIGGLTVKLKVGSGEAPSYAVVRCAMRDGTAKRHTLNFLSEDMLPYLVFDLRYYAVPRGIPVEVTGSRSAVEALSRIESGTATWTGY